MKFFIILLIFPLISGSLYALTGKEFMQKINSNYASLKSFEMTLDYKLYKGAKSNVIRDKYTSLMCVNGINSYRRIYNDVIITNEEMSVIINHELKTIQILPPVKKDVIDPGIESSLKYCEIVKISNQGSSKSIELVFKEYTTVPFSKIEIQVDNNFWIEKVNLYYSTQLNFSKSYLKPENGCPRLEINYNNLKKSWKDEDGIADISKVLLKEGTNYQTTETYNSYKILSQ